jgi:hypothetical protein
MFYSGCFCWNEVKFNGGEEKVESVIRATFMLTGLS